MQFFCFNLELKISFNSFTAFANIAHYILISIHSTYSRFNKVGTKNVNTHNYILKPIKKFFEILDRNENEFKFEAKYLNSQPHYYFFSEQ